MRRKTIITTALVAATTLAVGPVAGAPANRTKTTELTCTINAYQQGVVPSPAFIQFGFVSCPKPFGDGLHFSDVTVTRFPAPGAPGAANGTFTNSFDRGTTSGTFELTVMASSKTNLTYSGTITYTGGTGRFKRVRGGGTIECTTTDGGAHKLCTVNTTLTGV